MSDVHTTRNDGTRRSRRRDVSMLATGHGAGTVTPPSVPLATVIPATVATLLIGAALQAAAYGSGGHDALSDIPGRFFAWNVHPSLLPYRGVPIEYPVVIGYVTWVTSWFGQHAASFFLATGILGAALAVVMTVLLRERAGVRIWRWVFAVPLALYAFHNWDLVAMVPAVAGLVAFDRRRDRAAGVLLAVGASAKVFPAFVLPPLAVVRWRSGDRRGAVGLVGAFGLTTLLLNGPVAWWNWHAWTYPLSFQGGRTATWGSTWFWLLRTPTPHALVGEHIGAVTDLLVVGSLVGALVAISVLAVRRGLDPMAIGAAVVGVFLLTNKVYSPNYDLWIVPFFALLPVSRRVWATFVAADLGIYILVYGHIHDLGWSHATVETLLPWFVIARGFAIVALVFTALSSGSPRLTDPWSRAVQRGFRRMGHDSR